MKFSERVDLIMEYRNWRNKENEKSNFKIPYNPETFISFLQIKGYEIKRNDEDKTAKWIFHLDSIYAHLVCSNCLCNAPYDCKTNFCPNCGYKMEEKVYIE